MTNKLCILTCHNFAREVAAWAAAADLKDVAIKSFSGACLRPSVERAELEQIIHECAQEYSQVALFGGGCLTGLRDLEVEDRVVVCSAATCPDLALNRFAVWAYTEAGAYVTTPGWLNDWERLLARESLTRDEVRKLLGEATQRIVLLDTGVHDDSADRLRAFAGFVGLPCEIVPVGLDSLSLQLNNLLLNFRLSCQRNQSIADSAQATRQSADYAMLFDLISALGGITTEGEVVEKIFEVFNLLCAPSRLVYVPIVEGRPGDARARPTYLGVSEATKNRLAALRSGHMWTESGKGFALRIGRRNQVVAVLEVEGFAYPDLQRDYLNLALNIAPVLALAITNARQFQKLNAANNDLARSNAELEQFAAVVSNDLSVPLAAVTRSLGWFTGDHTGELSPEAAAHVAAAAAGASHMQRLIDGLLVYFQINMADTPFALTDCEVVVRRVIGDLAGPIGATGATVTFDPLPAVMGDSDQLALLFQSLIANALEFHSDRPPEVRIRAELQVTEATAGQAEIGWLFAIQDNGIGIDPEHAEQVFGLFRRAPGQEARGGKGLGLAICKKIVERHGGRIWFESTPGQGTTFYFTMPAG